MLDRRSAIRAGLGAVLLGKDRNMAYVDRHGQELKYLLRCVVETGEVTQLMRDEGGFVLDKDECSIVEQQAWYPAPLRVIPGNGRGGS